MALKDWKAQNSKPLKVSATAANRKKSGQKIYVTKVAMTVTAYDEAGQLDVPQSLTDTPSIGPGYFVTFPNTYNQTFAIPAVDSGATKITIDISYELVLEVDRTKLGRDFAKQVATDTITVPIAELSGSGPQAADRRHQVVRPVGPRRLEVEPRRPVGKRDHADVAERAVSLRRHGDGPVAASDAARRRISTATPVVSYQLASASARPS